MKGEKDALRNSRESFPHLSSHIEKYTDDVGKVLSVIEGDLVKVAEQKFPREDQDGRVLINPNEFLSEIDLDDLVEPIRKNNLEALEIGAEYHKKKVEKELEERIGLPTEVKAEITFDILNTFTARAIRQGALMAAQNIEGAVKDTILKTLLDGAREGYGIDKITRAIRDKVDEITKQHAELVARTETLSASRSGSQALAESTDLISGKEWIATNDNRTRPWHRAMDGVIRPKNELFVVPSGWSGAPDYQPRDYPRSARVVGQDQPFNCRCDQAPVLREDMPETVREFSEFGVKFKGLTIRQIELWKEHAESDESSFRVFWRRAAGEHSVRKLASKYGMSSNTVRKYNEELGV